MQNRELLATENLQSIGCWTESSNGHTTRVSFDECIEPTYDDLRYLASLPHLKDLCFYGTPVDGKILSALTCNQTLTHLNLNCTAISRDATKLLAKFPNLQLVGLMATSTDDDCLQSLLSCQHITNLRVDDTKITHVGTSSLVENLDLDTLWIGGTQLSAESLASISKLPRLREFHVCGKSVVDSHIDILLTFPNTVSVRNTRISDSGLLRLASIDPNASNVG